MQACVICGIGHCANRCSRTRLSSPVELWHTPENSSAGTNCGEQTATFQVTVLDVAKDLILAGGEQPKIVAVSISDARIPPEREAQFVPTWRPGAKGEPEAFAITIKPPLERVGTYSVVLNLLPISRPRAPRQTVQLIASAAKLDVPPKLLVERTIRWPVETDVRSTPLVVFETERVAGIRALTLTAVPFAIGTEPIPDLVIRKVGGPQSPAANTTAPAPASSNPGNAPTFEVNAGDQATLAYVVSGNLPLGTAMGSVRMTAPEQEKAVTIPVEIRSRSSLAYLFLAIVLGLTLSWFVKFLLQQLLEWNRARLAAGTLLANVEKDRTAYPDQPFRDAVKQPMEDLSRSTGDADIQAIETSRAALDTAWRAARQDLETRRMALRTQADGWGKIISLSWELPPRVRVHLETARNALPQAMAHDAQGDVARAKASLDGAQAAAAEGIHRAAREWQRAERAFFDRLAAGGPGMSNSILSPLKIASDHWRGQYAEIDPTPTRNPEQVEPRLRQVMGEYVASRENLEEVRRRLQREHDEVAKALTGIDSALVTKVQESLDALSADLASAADDPEAADANLPALREALQESWRNAFAAAAPGNKAVQDAVAQRDFSEAADLVGGGAPLLSTALPASILDLFAVRVAPPPRAAGAVAQMASMDPAGPYAVLLRESKRGIMRAKFWQSFFTGVLFIGWATSTYGATFDGTWGGTRDHLFLGVRRRRRPRCAAGSVQGRGPGLSRLLFLGPAAVVSGAIRARR
jgi:hypothetical protein